MEPHHLKPMPVALVLELEVHTLLLGDWQLCQLHRIGVHPKDCVDCRLVTPEQTFLTTRDVATDQQWLFRQQLYVEEDYNNLTGRSK